MIPFRFYAGDLLRGNCRPALLRLALLEPLLSAFAVTRDCQCLAHRRKQAALTTLLVENPARTAQYLADRDSRMAALRAELAQNHPMPSAPSAPPSITLEIGCGHGHFLNAYGEAHPRSTCVGIDLIGDRINRCKKKRDRARLHHVFFYQTEAHEFLECLAPTIRFADIFILFPDPWPKRRHHKNRIIQPAFLDLLATRAMPEARLCFRTDYKPYFLDAFATVNEHSRWQIPDAPELAWPFEQETVFQSRAADGHHSLVAGLRVGATKVSATKSD